MADSPPPRIEVLALSGAPERCGPLVSALHRAGLGVDVASDLSSARALFFGAGGHDCLVIGHDVRPGVAAAVVQALRAVAPDLATATFGPKLVGAGSARRHARLTAFHPTSRAGTGALLRFLLGLPGRTPPE
ncbi:MAG: hypothetical protein JNK49_02190 [Planctomycetes bacterium]|nr:hypothetical protein [Planctomycetota bacterium]